MPRPERVDPCVKLKATGMGFIDGEFERIIKRLGRASHLAGQVFGPWFKVGLVECIRRRSHLEDGGVHVELYEPVEHRAQLILLLPDGKPRPRRPVNVGDTRDPGGAKLPLDGWCGRDVCVDRSATS